ncbi:hypothetical protein [Prevotella nigrescens]|jgi:hypothetical protein|uniref:hypothetical protein n=1 Tax=Prevotella nigrescens TaxID=28133 RepID=UPI001C6050A9|nr:hypothetical protein [Prevotella nigrescens]MBW4726074.1 hypothetical protein [Prevotella nigrescens]
MEEDSLLAERALSCISQCFEMKLELTGNQYAAAYLQWFRQLYWLIGVYVILMFYRTATNQSLCFGISKPIVLHGKRACFAS